MPAHLPAGAGLHEDEAGVPQIGSSASRSWTGSRMRFPGA